jgi:GNAT superfamily N-acetyltransferase
VAKRVDEKPVWSIVCFFVDPKDRGKGIMEGLLEGAIHYARSQGATLLEAYPVDMKERTSSDWWGVKRMYDRAGFTEVARRKKTRPVMRRKLRPQLA